MHAYVTNNDRIVGTCSLCGGPVVLPKVYLSTVPPVPTCRSCGATAKPNYGPVIDMNPRPRRQVTPETAYRELKLHWGNFGAPKK